MVAYNDRVMPVAILHGLRRSNHARHRDYEDGDFDPPKRSSPYQNSPRSRTMTRTITTTQMTIMTMKRADIRRPREKRRAQGWRHLWRHGETVSRCDCAAGRVLIVLVIVSLVGSGRQDAGYRASPPEVSADGADDLPAPLCLDRFRDECDGRTDYTNEPDLAVKADDAYNGDETWDTGDRG